MNNRTAVLYARVSSREQREEGFSIEAQVKLLRTFAVEKGLTSRRSLSMSSRRRPRGANCSMRW